MTFPRGSSMRLRPSRKRTMASCLPSGSPVRPIHELGDRRAALRPRSEPWRAFRSRRVPRGSARAARSRALPTARRRRDRRSSTPIGSRLGPLGTRRVDLDRLSFPRGAVDDAAARPARSGRCRCCRGETSAAGRSARMAGPGARPDARGRRRRRARPAASATRRMRSAGGAAGRPPPKRPPRSLAEVPEQRLEREGDVVRGVEALLGILLEAVADDALEAGGDVLVRHREVGRVFRRIADIVSAAESPWNARLPESIS